jgi:hypothetical protein
MTAEASLRALCQLAKFAMLAEPAIASGITFAACQDVMTTLQAVQDEISSGVVPDTEWLQTIPEPLREAVRQQIAVMVADSTWPDALRRPH